MNLVAESKGTSATRGALERASSTSIPSLRARVTSAPSVGSPMTWPSAMTLSLHNAATRSAPGRSTSCAAAGSRAVMAPSSP